MKNKLGIEIPEKIEGVGSLIPFQGEFTLINSQTEKYKTPQPIRKSKTGHKLLPDLKNCLEKLSLRDGMCISFHHHFRGGDETVFKVISLIAEMGFKNLTIASSSLTTAHDPLIPFVENGVISRIWTSGLREKLGKTISAGKLGIPVIFHSHGGRARAIETGKLKVDLAFIAAAAADCEGNATGSFGKSACGALGYPMVDSEYAAEVVVLTDNLVEFPCHPASIKQHNVDYVVPVDRIGDPKKIGTGSTRLTRNPLDLRIAQLATQAIDKCGYIKPGFSLQTGAGGASLAVAKFIRELQRERKIKGSFLLGGITSTMVEILEEGLFNVAYDVQSFDDMVTHSIYKNQQHVEISSSQYANPFNAGCFVNMLDVVILAALEVDTDFNVNVLTGSDGLVMGASGGHCDTAAGAKLTVVVAPSMRARTPIVRDKIATIVTPGCSVDLLVTERGICVNPARTELIETLKRSRLPILEIHDLAKNVEKLCGKPAPIEWDDKIVGLVEYRDGSIIDVIRKVKS
ncbi:MAG: citrate lyase subunit alpha [Candidatus Wallbacteria bacterium]|nr:citrate lyase subunit alpha [Candidatus Wallbacteria bacterium]